MAKRHWYTGLSGACKVPRSLLGWWYEISPSAFLDHYAVAPDRICTDCAKAARLALAAESAPKPSDIVWPKPRPISEAPTDGTPVIAYWSEQEYPRMRGLRWGVAKYGSGLVWFNEQMDTPGYLVKQALAHHGWDQRTLAIVCGWSESKVSRMLTDQELMTAVESLALAELLPELSAEQLLSAQSHLELARARLRYRPKPIAIPRTDSHRYAELRSLVEAWQSHQAGSSTALADWRHK